MCLKPKNINYSSICFLLKENKSPKIFHSKYSYINVNFPFLNMTHLVHFVIGKVIIKEKMLQLFFYIKKYIFKTK